MKKLLLVLALAFSCNANAKIIEVKATGIAESYDEAVNKALDNAIKKTSVVTVNKTAPNAKFEGEFIGKKVSAKVVQDNIRYSGKVQSYDVLSHEEDDDIYTVVILAKVKKAEPKKKVEPKKYVSPLKRKGYKPSLLIGGLIMPSNYSCLNNNVDNAILAKNFNLNFVNTIINSNKFRVLDRSEHKAYAGELKLMLSGLADKSEITKVGKLASADYFLTTEIIDYEVEDESTVIESIGERHFKANAKVKIGYKLVEVAKMQVVTTAIIEYSVPTENQNFNCNKYVEKSAVEMSNKMAAKLLKKLFNYNLKTTESKVVSSSKIELPGFANSQTENTPQRPVIKLPVDNRNPVKLPFD